MTANGANSLHTPETPLRRPSRLRGALLSLRGRPTVPDQIRAEWAGFLWEAEAVFDKIAAAANRLATRDKRDLDRALKRVQELELEHPCECDDQTGPAPIGGGYGWDPRKMVLNRKLLEAEGYAFPQVNGGSDVVPDTSEQG